MNRRTLLASGVALAGAAGMGGWAAAGRGSSAPARTAAPPAGTATVRRTDLAAREQVPGALGYAGDRPVEHTGPPGVLTAAPAPGTVVERGRQLYEVDGRPVVLLYGARPMWRDLGPGATPGEDVRQLEENLAALGHLRSTVDDRFTAATGAAVRRWQARSGRPVTGRLALGGAVFAPGPVRVSAVAMPLGARVGGGPVLRVSSTRRVVTMAMQPARVGQVAPGTPVEVALPDGQRLPGTVEAIGEVTESTIGVTVGVTVDLGAAQLSWPDRTPAQVTVTTAQRRGVLAVPVTALRAATAPGGFEVLVVDGAVRRAVPVRPGLLDERSGLVEVTGLAEGVRVEVPA